MTENLYDAFISSFMSSNVWKLQSSLILCSTDSIRVSKRWQNYFIFGWTLPFSCQIVGGGDMVLFYKWCTKFVVFCLKIGSVSWPKTLHCTIMHCLYQFAESFSHRQWWLHLIKQLNDSVLLLGTIPVILCATVSFAICKVIGCNSVTHMQSINFY